MLIDIEKYVRQLLPPNRRKPGHIGLCTSLFSPIDAVIKDLNSFSYDSQFDTGTPGQVAVLEFILQSYVNANIKVIDADGIKTDFRVLVPESLSSSDRGEVVRIVERYRLRSKRYQVTDLVDWGGGDPGPVIGLAFSPTPYAEPVAQGWNLSVGLNKSGIYPLKIVNTTTGNVRLMIENFEFVAGAAYYFNLTEEGNYKITIGPLTGNANAQNVAESTTQPDWLVDLSVTWDANSHDCRFWLHSLNDVDCDLLITENNNVPVSGKSWQGVVWNQNTWIAGDREWSATWSEEFIANPIAFGNGGMLPGSTYRIKVRRAQSPGDVFVFIWEAPSVSIVTPQLVVFEVDTPDLPDCAYGPFVSSIISVTQTRLYFLFDAWDVKQFKWKIKSGATVVASGVTDMVTGPDRNIAIFNPSNHPYITYPSLSPGSYTLEIEGSECNSTPSTKPFEIEGEDEEPEPPVVTGPVTPKVELRGLPEHMKITVGGSSENWTLNDISVAEPPASGFEYFYQIGNQVLRQSTPLTNYKWESNRPVRILKSKPKIGLGSLAEYNGDNDWQRGNWFSRNCTMAITVIVFNEL
jgi:hypothetical protein